MSEIRFIADVMVGRLARWLRVLGFDAAYSNTYEDDEIIRMAEEEKRVILTRDTGLAARRRNAECLLIKSVNYREQVGQVLATFDLRQFSVFSRCLECNAGLKDVDRESVFERVPPYVYLTQERFAICPCCSRIYWHGTHADRMLRQIPVISE